MDGFFWDNIDLEGSIFILKLTLNDNLDISLLNMCGSIEMHVHAKYDVYVATMTYFKLTLKDDLELDMLPWNMCVSFRNTMSCMQNMKTLCVIQCTVNLGYNELGYQESSAIRNNFEIPESFPSLFYMK